jgi:predicted PurR-regulated permease PerM
MTDNSAKIARVNEQDASRPRIEDRVLTGLVLLFTVAFALVVEPFFAAILWAVIAAILFAPLNRRLLRRMPGRRNGAALLTLLLIVAIVIVPAILLTLALLQEAGAAYARLQAGAIDFAQLFERLRASLPEWAVGWLRRLGLNDFSAVQTRIAAGIAASVRTLAAQAFHIGQGAFSLLISLGVMLYLTFFLLRDGEQLMRRVIEATPLRAAQRQALFDKFTVVVRATIKGSVVVAIVQGLIGGIVFWLIGISGALLWGVLMGVLSLLPAVGTGIVWVPVAIYLFATGAVGQGIILVLCGMFVIGLVDNILRPILVGRDTRMPDYVVLITTLGGLDLFGFSGLIIGPVIAALFIAIWDIVTTMRLGPSGAGPAA